MKTLMALLFVGGLAAQTPPMIPMATGGGPVGGATNLTTVGSVPYVSASGTLDQDAGQFFWDATNNRLGIGSNAPITLLHAQGPAFTTFTNNPATLFMSSTDAYAANMGAGILFAGKLDSGNTTLSTYAYIGGLKENATDGNGAGKLVFGTRQNGTGANDMTRMTILSSGNVGIGTITPATSLQVAGGKILLDNAQGIQFKDSAGTARTILQVDSGDNVYLDSAATGGDMFFRASGVDKMTIKGTSGNVGIGTTGPTYKLDVAKSGSGGTARFYDQTASTGATRVLITLGAADTTSTQVFEIGGLMKFSGSNSTGAGSALLGTNSPATTNTAPYTWLKVLTSDGSTAYVPAWK